MPRPPGQCPDLGLFWRRCRRWPNGYAHGPETGRFRVLVFSAGPESREFFGPANVVESLLCLMSSATHKPVLLRALAQHLLRALVGTYPKACRVTRPRFVKAGEVIMGTRRCSERRFFLRPSSVTDQLFLYCLARAARLSGVLLHDFQVLSNHYHVVFTDVRGQRPLFFRELNQFVARGVNASLGRWESFFAPGSYNAVALVDGDAIEDECLYVHCNVVEAGLVKLPEYWDGVCSWKMEYGQPRTIRRPTGFFRDPSDRTLEEEVLTLVRPEALYPELEDAEARALLRDKARERSHAIAEKFRDSGGSFMGMRRVRRQPPHSSPNTRAPRRGIRPTVAGKNKWARIEALQRNKAFLEAHHDARLEFEAGQRRVVFPLGTYLMVQRFGVAVAKS